MPFIRGVFNFIDSMVLGMKTLTYSASFIEEEEEERTSTDKEEAKKQERKESIFMGITVAFPSFLRLAFSWYLPYFIINLAGEDDTVPEWCLQHWKGLYGFLFLSAIF